ncbi:hypothetical protein FRC07_005815 [Ceratobasidium sp. 392]|nr:hypothetical protein FRC07_005815 [Ceratobasidium sp. 392]
MADVPALTPSPPADLVEITPAEYEGYYFTRNGRLFPRHRLPPDQRDDPNVQLPSILPVDARDMERRTVQHNLVHLARGSHTFGPFEQCMTPPQNKVVLDIGSASGRWIEDVSEEMGHVPHCHGIEIVPLSPTATPRVYFEVYDFQREAIRQAESKVDVVHARFQNFHILYWPGFLRDVARVLKPGGLFMSGELDIPLQYTDAAAFPATIHLYNQIVHIMGERGYTPNVGETMPTMLATLPTSTEDDTPLFTNIGSETITIPVGRNHPVQEQRELSVLAMDSLIRLSSSLKPFMTSFGLQASEIDGLITAHRQELNRNELNAGCAQMTYRMTWAQRR